VLRGRAVSSKSSSYVGCGELGRLARQRVAHDPIPDYGSPAVWDDGDCYVIQGWRITDPGTLAQVGLVPTNETVLRLPKRMMQFFKEVSNDGAARL
jgi:hypothetical protein